MLAEIFFSRSNDKDWGYNLKAEAQLTHNVVTTSIRRRYTNMRRRRSDVMTTLCFSWVSPFITSRRHRSDVVTTLCLLGRSFGSIKQGKRDSFFISLIIRDSKWETVTSLLSNTISKQRFIASIQAFHDNCCDHKTMGKRNLLKTQKKTKDRTNIPGSNKTNYLECTKQTCSICERQKIEILRLSPCICIRCKIIHQNSECSDLTMRIHMLIWAVAVDYIPSQHST